MEDCRSRKPTAADCAAGRTHVVYELRLLREVVAAHSHAMVTLPGARASLADRRSSYCKVSALRDSALLHSRALCEFFLKDRLSRDDMAAADYVPTAGWHPTGKLVGLAADIEDINKFRSHLTYTRTDRSRTWSVDVFLREIESAFQSFLAEMEDAERAEWRVLLDDNTWLPVRDTGRRKQQ